MTGPRCFEEEEIAELLRLLRPVPDGWVSAAQELPRARRELDQILELAEADTQFRQALIADLEAALEQAGWHPEPRLVCDLRERLAPGRGIGA